MPITDYQYINYRNVDGVAVVTFLETVAMFDTDKVKDVARELMDLLESKRFTKILLNLSNARFISSAMLAHLVKLIGKLAIIQLLTGQAIMLQQRHIDHAGGEIVTDQFADAAGFGDVLRHDVQLCLAAVIRATVDNRTAGQWRNIRRHR